MLEPALQDSKKIPKWDSRSCQGIFMGFSSEHSPLVPLVLNPTTKHISPQYHVIFDDDFTTVPSLNTIEERDKLFEQLFEMATEYFIDPDDVDARRSLLRDEWLSPLDQQRRATSSSLLPTDPSHLSPPSDQMGDSRGRAFGFRGRRTTYISEGDASSPCLPQCLSPVQSPIPHLPSSPVLPDRPCGSPDPAPALPRYPACTGRGTWWDGPALDRSHPFTKGQWITSLLAAYSTSLGSSWGQPPAAVANVGSRNGPVYGSIKTRRSAIAHSYLMQDDWSSLCAKLDYGPVDSLSAYPTPDFHELIGSMLLSEVQPHILKAKAEKHDADNPS
eukprot:CCRYP_013059-RA/>CCRYP_013059-RA protein AED:0.64 eAED:0.36 QI:0/0/0/1/0/0.5/2/0/330